MTAIPLEERVNWIGSSESAVILGCSPFNTYFTLWHEKAGNIPAEDLDHLERIQAGKHLEPAIAAWAAEKWDDWSPRKVTGYLEHPTTAKMGASLDFEDGADPSGPPIEIKNVDWMIFKDHWLSEGDAVLDAPIHYLLQLQHQLACRPSATYGWLLACVGGNKLYRMKVDRHSGIIARLETEVAAFWESITQGQEPKPDFENDGATIARLYSSGNGEVLDMTDNNRMPELCSLYQTAKGEEKAAKERAGAAIAEIKAMLGEASGATCTGFTVKSTDIPGGEVKASTRNPYRRWTITETGDTAA